MSVAAKRMGLTKQALASVLDSPFDVPSDQLLALLNRLGQKVEIIVSPLAPGEREATVMVRSGGERAAA